MISSSIMTTFSCISHLISTTHPRFISYKLDVGGREPPSTVRQETHPALSLGYVAGQRSQPRKAHDALTVFAGLGGA
jgi:hypothetical protein